MTPINSPAVTRNIALVLRTNDINKLSDTGYRFLSLLQGFIAHYDLNGFKDYYCDVATLVHDVSSSADVSDPERYIRDSFFAGGTDAAYYRSKFETLVGLRELVGAYRQPARPGNTRTSHPAVGRQYRLFEDGGHGWLEVPRAHVVASGAVISAYSFYDERTGMAYLEEDCDMPAYLRAIGCGSEAIAMRVWSSRPRELARYVDARTIAPPETEDVADALIDLFGYGLPDFTTDGVLDSATVSAAFQSLTPEQKAEVMAYLGNQEAGASA
jgi:hypothetical protein